MVISPRLIRAVIVIAILIIVGACFTYAEMALPGESLYKLKVSVSEPISGLFALSKEERTEWQERLVERRLEEARKLATQNKLTAVSRTKLETLINNEMAKFNSYLSILASEKDDSLKSIDLNTRMQASLSANKSLLGNILSNNEINDLTKTETDKFITSIAQYGENVSNSNASIIVNTQADAQLARDALMSAKTLFQRERMKLPFSIQTSISDKLVKAESNLKDGQFHSVIELTSEAKLSILSNVLKSDLRIEDDGDSGDDREGVEEDDDFED